MSSHVIESEREGEGGREREGQTVQHIFPLITPGQSSQSNVSNIPVGHYNIIGSPSLSHSVIIIIIRSHRVNLNY